MDNMNLEWEEGEEGAKIVFKVRITYTSVTGDTAPYMGREREKPTSRKKEMNFHRKITG